MIKEEFKNKLVEILTNDINKNFNINGLISFMEESDINYHMADLTGPLGLASFDGVYIDVNQIIRHISHDYGTILYFVILHETAHMKRMMKIGKTEILNNLSLPDFELFFEHVVNEELIADKYGSLMYYLLNKKLYPSFYTQQLNDSDNKERYKTRARGFFGQIQNDETKYKQFVNKFIKKIY